MRCIALLAFFLIALNSASTTKGGFIVDVAPTVTRDSFTNVFTYTYDVSNLLENANDGDPDVIFDFSLSVAPESALTQFVSPLGWDLTYSTGDSVIEWSASDEQFTISSGNFLTFSFNSMLSPGNQDCTVLVLNQGNTNVDFASAATIAPTSNPTAIPEPSALLLWSSALATVAVGSAFPFLRRGWSN